MSDSVRLERLESELLVRNAIAGYCEAMDDADVGGIERHFAEAASLLAADGSRHEGRDAIVGFFSALMDAPERPWARHHVTNTVVDVSDPTRVRARSRFLFLVGGQPATVASGTYVDVFETAEGRAVCLDKVVTVDQMLSFTEAC